MHAIYELIKMGHSITDQLGVILKEHGVSEPQYNVLRILKSRNGEPVAVKEISDNMIQRSSNVTRIVDKLLEKALVNRKECPTNRRKMDITITSKGEKLLTNLDKVVEEFHRPLSEELTKNEASQLRELVLKLKTNK